MLARTATLLGCAGALVAGIYEAAVRGIADAHYTNARLVLGDALEGGRPAARDALSQALGSLTEARRLEPSNPHFAEQWARVREALALGLERTDPAARQGVREALAAFRGSARMRPGSPYVWSSIAVIKYRLNATDFEFYGALERAGRYGPWEPRVQLAMLDLGLATWPSLARPARAWVAGAMDRALLRNEQEVRRIAGLHGTAGQLCREALLPARLAAFCVKK
jgi:hypothetical protein